MEDNSPGLYLGQGCHDKITLSRGRLLRAVVHCASAELSGRTLEAIKVAQNLRRYASDCLQERILRDGPRPGVLDDRSNHIPRGPWMRRARHDELLEESLLGQAVNFRSPL